MRLAFFSALALLSVSANSGIGNAADGKNFAGTWRTDDASPITVLSGTNLPSKRWFIIDNENPDSVTTRVTLNVDGQDLVFPINSFGSALVYGKDITIKQSTPSGPSTGKWQTFSNDNLVGTTFQWTSNVQSSTKTTVAQFDVPRTFLLAIYYADSPTGCASKTTVFVDGMPIQRPVTGGQKTVEFLSGTSVFGKGTIVQVDVAGSCLFSKGTFTVLSD